MNTTCKLYTLDYREVKTYLVTSLFILGNILLPQLFHFIPQGGVTWLPIYFFTLIAAYKFGWKAGLLTAILSPVINSLLFMMPSPEVLPGILLKSALLAVAAGYAANRFQRISLPILVMIVLSYQIVGTFGEWIMTGSFAKAFQDFRIGLPGMAMQVIGGYLFIRYIFRR